jgi:hypothetical protein
MCFPRCWTGFPQRKSRVPERFRVERVRLGILRDRIRRTYSQQIRQRNDCVSTLAHGTLNLYARISVLCFRASSALFRWCLSVQNQLLGCGKENLRLTLYRVPSYGKAEPLANDFRRLACGHVATTPELHSYGVLLCESCARGHGLEPMEGDHASGLSAT